MAKNITAKDVAAAKLILAAYEAQGKAKAPKGKKAKWTDRKGRTFKQARKAHYVARQNRFETTANGGLTKGQRQEIAASLPYGYSSKQWDKAVAKFKKGGFR